MNNDNPHKYYAGGWHTVKDIEKFRESINNIINYSDFNQTIFSKVVKELYEQMNKTLTTANQEVININSVFAINGRVDMLAKDNFGGIVSIGLNKDEVEKLISLLQESIKED